MAIGRNGNTPEVIHLRELNRVLNIDFGVPPFKVQISSENVRRACGRMKRKHKEIIVALDHRYGITGERELIETGAELARRLDLTRQAVSHRLRRGHMLLREMIQAEWLEAVKLLAETEMGPLHLKLPAEAAELTIDDLDIRVRTRNCLIAHNLWTVAAILEKGEKWFKHQRGFGVKTRLDLEKALRLQGLRLR